MLHPGVGQPRRQPQRFDREIRSVRVFVDLERIVLRPEKSRELAYHLYDIEQKRQALGASTSFQVMQLARDLAVAESNLVVATTAYEKSRVELDRATGNTLARNNIRMEDAATGRVGEVPQIPGVVPRSTKQLP